MPTKILFILLTCILSSQVKATDFNINFLGHLQYDETLSGIWGYTSPGGSEYALVGTELGTSIVLIDNPQSPQELFFIEGVESFWREVRTFEHYAYITTEGGGGLQIVDMSALPDSIQTYNWTGPNDTVYTSHTIFIDENGFAYVNGFNNKDRTIPAFKRGILILDLNNNPTNPEIVGLFDGHYVHDCYGRNDTIYAAMIYAGQVAVIDVSDKSNPVLSATFETAGSFTHNTWLSDNGKVLFTTDEIENGYIAAYDITNLASVQELDRIRILPGSGLIPHNVHYKNGFLVASYYRTGVVVIDAKSPDNLIEVGRYNTSLFEPGPGFFGAWGIYPYFNSGRVIVSDMENGLSILSPDYLRGAYLEGFVFDDKTGLTVFSVNIEVKETSQRTRTNFNGGYKTGAPKSGLYDIVLSRQGCNTTTITDVTFTAGLTTYKNFFISCQPTSVEDLNLTEKPYSLIYTVNGNFVMQFENQTVDFNTLEIFNLKGQQIEQLPVNQFSASEFGTNYLPGIYLYQLTSKDGRVTFSGKVYKP